MAWRLRKWRLLAVTPEGVTCHARSPGSVDSVTRPIFFPATVLHGTLTAFSVTEMGKKPPNAIKKKNIFLKSRRNSRLLPSLLKITF